MSSGRSGRSTGQLSAFGRNTAESGGRGGVCVLSEERAVKWHSSQPGWPERLRGANVCDLPVSGICEGSGGRDQKLG